MARSTVNKSGKPSREHKQPRKAVSVEEPAESPAEDDSEDEGIDQVGLEKLLEALGEDGLDDFDQAQLQALACEEEDDESDPRIERGSDAEEEEAGSARVGSVQHSVEEDEGVALDEVDVVLDEDAVPQQKILIDNKIALERIRDMIKLDPSLPWTETLTVTYPETISVDIDDDLNRELAFYKQALHGANAARSLAAKHKLPFTRPSDYFAEMVKSDSHMERIRQRLLDESASIKKGEDKRREREGKKYGKQVQIERLKERERSKKDMEDRLKGLKRKRKGALDNAQADDEGFDIAVEDAISDRPAKRVKGAGGDSGNRMSRKSRDGKFGFGGAGRRSKQNTRSSTDDFDSTRGPRRGGFGGKKSFGKGGGGARRPGKSKRMNTRL